MATSKELKNKITLNGIVELFGFPTLPELVIDGINISEDLYRKLVIRLAQHYLDTVHLTLTLAGEDRFQLEPFADGDWNDVAYWLGNLINQEAGAVKITAPGDFLSQGKLKGKAFETIEEAVLDNLDSLRNSPEVFGMGSPGDALRKAAENALEVKKVREMVYEQAAGW